MFTRYGGPLSWSSYNGHTALFRSIPCRTRIYQRWPFVRSRCDVPTNTQTLTHALDLDPPEYWGTNFPQARRCLALNLTEFGSGSYLSEPCGQLTRHSFEHDALCPLCVGPTPSLTAMDHGVHVMALDCAFVKISAVRVIENIDFLISLHIDILHPHRIQYHQYSAPLRSKAWWGRPSTSLSEVSPYRVS